MRLFEPYLGLISSLAFGGDRPLLAMGTANGVSVFDTAKLLRGELSMRSMETRDAINRVAWHPNRPNVFACAGSDSVVELYSHRLRLRQQLISLDGQQGPIVALAFSPDGRRLAYGGGWWDEAACVLVVNTRTWQRETGFYPHTNQVGVVCFTQADMLASGGADKTLFLHDLHTQQRVLEWPMQARIQDMVVSPDGSRLAVAAGSAIRLTVLNEQGIPNIDEVAFLRGHTQAIRALAFSPDGRLMASVSEDHSLRVWEVDSGLVRHVFDLGLGALRTLAFTPDGLMVLVAGDRGTLALVDVE